MASGAPKIEDFERVLVVEGYSDLLFYAEVLEVVGKHEEVFIKHFNGVSDLIFKLETFITPTLLTSKSTIAFIIDADTNPTATRTSLENLLSRLTGQSVLDGKWTAGKPKIGLFIVPGGDSPGEIETLVWHSWANDPANDPQKKCVENFVSCMEAAGVKSQSPDKGLVSAVLAIRHDEDPRLGPGARGKAFDLGRQELLPLRTFLGGF